MANDNIIIPDDLTDAVIDKNKYVVVNAPNATKIINNTTSKVSGLPAGGTTGQVLAKATDADYDVNWVDTEGGGGGGGETPTVYEFVLSGSSGILTNLTQEEILALSNDPAHTKIIFNEPEHPLRQIHLPFIGKDVYDGFQYDMYGAVIHLPNEDYPRFYYAQINVSDLDYGVGLLELQTVR